MRIAACMVRPCGLKTRTTPPRRGAGVVERGGLENRCGCKPTQGSNPCLSAIIFFWQENPSNTLNGKVVFGVRSPSFRAKVICSAKASLRTVRWAIRLPLFQSFQGFDRNCSACSNICSKVCIGFPWFCSFSSKISFSRSIFSMRFS